VTTALLVVAALAALWRAERVLTAALKTKAELQVKELELQGRRVALEEKRMSASLEPDEIPIDLRARYMGETQDWAREQVRSLIQQLYAQHKNWDSVRADLTQLDAESASASGGWSQTTVMS
jgi:hypothetical protein